MASLVQIGVVEVAADQVTMSVPISMDQWIVDAQIETITAGDAAVFFEDVTVTPARLRGGIAWRVKVSGDQAVYVRFDGGVATATTGFLLDPGETFEVRVTTANVAPSVVPTV